MAKSNSRKGVKRARRNLKKYLAPMPGDVFIKLIPKFAELAIKPFNGYEYMRDDPCIYCGKPGTSWDHIFAQSLHKGENPNRARTCKRCNGTKGQLGPIAFMSERIMKLRYCQKGHDKVLRNGDIDKSRGCRVCRAVVSRKAALRRVRSF